MPKARQSTAVARQPQTIQARRIPSEEATYTSSTEPPRQRSQRRTRPVREYGPTQLGEKTSGGIGLLEAEYFAIIFLLLLQLFISKADYSSKMLSFMKRGTLATILFFFLALIAGVGDNAAKISKAIGALVFFSILLTSPGSDVINALDGLFKAGWTGESAPNSSADTGTQQATTGVADRATQKAKQAANNSANTITEIQIPGIGPVFAFKDIADNLRKWLHL